MEYPLSKNEVIAIEYAKTFILKNRVACTPETFLNEYRRMLNQLILEANQVSQRG